ncbi:uncharacterized protein LOC117318727 [Pecten maximus]|uniref:uncharacterized protein LOC117318727 n=1 Tax=Pecten maximus TaxID=6579 RepID=UPI0014580E13|nr:uncharacterized protein LOC117318727 [Pecten maximus]
MDSFYITVIVIILVLPTCFQASVGATTKAAPTEETTCPRFQTRTENGSLIVLYQASNENCEMVVTTATTQLRPSTEVKAFKNKHKTIRRPSVSFRNTSSLDGEFPCDSLTHSSLGPFVFVNTVPNQCQILFRIHKTKNHNHEKKKPKAQKTKSNGGRKGKKRGGKKEKLKRIPKFHFIPVFEYIDEILY